MTSPAGAIQEFRRHGLVVVAALLGIGAGVSSLPLYTAGLFVGQYEAAFGWSRAEASSGQLALVLGVACAAPWIGRGVDRFGARPIAILSMLALACGFFLLQLQQGSYLVYLLLMFAIGATAAGSSPITFTRVVNGWFERGRGLALGLSLAGTGVAASIAPAVLAYVIEAEGWQHGFLVLALVVLAVIPVVALLLVEPPHLAPPPARRRVEPGSYDRRRFLLLLASFGLGAVVIGGLMVQLVPLLADRGVPIADRTLIVGSIGVSVIAGRLLVGAAMDRFFAPYLGIAVLLLAAFACVLFLVGTVTASLASAVLLGLSLGAEVDLASYLVVRYFGLRAYGRIYGLLYAGILLSSGAGPILLGLLHDRFQSYDLALGAASVILVIAAGLLLALGRYPAETVATPVLEGCLARET